MFNFSDFIPFHIWLVESKEVYDLLFIVEHVTGGY